MVQDHLDHGSSKETVTMNPWPDSLVPLIQIIWKECTLRHIYTVQVNYVLCITIVFVNYIMKLLWVLIHVHNMKKRNRFFLLNMTEWPGKAEIWPCLIFYSMIFLRHLESNQPISRPFGLFCSNIMTSDTRLFKNFHWRAYSIHVHLHW